MRVLGLSFGNLDESCDITCKEALMGAEEAGAEVHFIRVMDLSLKDDCDWLIGEMKLADGLLIADPVTNKSTCGLFQTFGELVMEKKEELAGKAVSFIGVAHADWDYFIESAHAIQSAMMGWKLVDNDCCRWSELLLMDDNKLARTHQIGVTLVVTQKNGFEGMKKRENATGCPVCGGNTFQMVAETGRIRCCVCGSEGMFQMDGVHTRFEVQTNMKGREQNTSAGIEYQKKEIKHRYHKLDEIYQTKMYEERMEHYQKFLKPERPIRF